jgi:hypothetical protein
VVALIAGRKERINNFSVFVLCSILFLLIECYYENLN